MTAASTAPSRTRLRSPNASSIGKLGLAQERQIALGQLVEDHDAAAALAAKRRHVRAPIGEVLGHVEQLVLVAMTGLAYVRRHERADARAPAKVVDGVELQHHRR